MITKRLLALWSMGAWAMGELAQHASACCFAFLYGIPDETLFVASGLINHPVDLSGLPPPPILFLPSRGQWISSTRAVALEPPHRPRCTGGRVSEKLA